MLLNLPVIVYLCTVSKVFPASRVKVSMYEYTNSWPEDRNGIVMSSFFKCSKSRCHVIQHVVRLDVVSMDAKEWSSIGIYRPHFINESFRFFNLSWVRTTKVVLSLLLTSLKLLDSEFPLQFSTAHLQVPGRFWD